MCTLHLPRLSCAFSVPGEEQDSSFQRELQPIVPLSVIFANLQLNFIL